MNELLILPMITERDGVPVTTSRALADHFGKQHKNVLRDIEATIAQLNQTGEGKAFSRLNFEPRTALDSRGKEQPLYILTRDAFTLLAMGFTGSRALAFKVAYINAFNRMEQLITGRAEAQAFPAQPPAAALPPFSDRFLGAIRQALDSGRYTLHRKGRPTAVIVPGSEIIGAYDDHDVILSITAAQAIHKATTGEHISHEQLRVLLVSEGTARDDKGRQRGRQINGRELHCIRIPRALLRFPSV